MLIIGIDNGLNGGIAVLDEDGVIQHLVCMPTSKIDGRNQVSLSLIQAKMLVHESESIVYIEKPVGSKSLRAAISMADSFARVETVMAIATQDLPVRLAARTWQKALLKGYKGDTKEKAWACFKDLFRGCEDMVMVTSKGNKSKNPHDGLVDAILIAEYGRRILHGDA